MWDSCNLYNDKRKMDPSTLIRIFGIMICIITSAVAQNAIMEGLKQANGTLESINSTLEGHVDSTDVGRDTAYIKPGPEDVIPHETKSTNSMTALEDATFEDIDVVKRRNVFPTIKSLFDYKLSADKKFIEPTLERKDSCFLLDIDMGLQTLVELEDESDMLSTVVEFSVTWMDTSFRWDLDLVPRATISLPDDTVWTPRIVVVNPQVMQDIGRQMNVKSVVRFSHKGKATWLFTRNIDTKCEVDTTFYPFDTQTCHIQIRFDVDTKLKVNLNHINFLGDNNNWNISFYSLDTAKDRDTDYCVLDIRLDLDRKPLAIVLNVILPISILVTLSPLVFLLPKEPGDRLGLSLTTLLAVSVYMTMVADTLPKTSDPIPVISIVLFLWYISLSCIVIMILVIAKIARLGEDKKPPIWVRKVAFVSAKIFRLKFACNKFKCDKDEENEIGSKDAPNEINARLFRNGNGDKTHGGTDSGEESTASSSESHTTLTNTHVTVTWRQVSTAMDRWLVVIIYILKIIVLIALLIVALEKGEPERPVVGCTVYDQSFNYAKGADFPISHVNETSCEILIDHYKKTSDARLLKCMFDAEI